MGKEVDVLLFTGYGRTGFGGELGRLLEEKPYPTNRVGEVVEYLKGLTIEKQGWLPKFKALKNGEILRVSENVFYCGNDIHPAEMTLETVETSERWTIDEYDGSEYVEYLDRHELIDEGLNFWREV